MAPLPDPYLVKRFWESPNEALLTGPVVAAGRNCSPALLERERWQKVGPRYLKIGSRVLYRKADVLAWLRERELESPRGKQSCTVAVDKLGGG